MDLSDQKSIEFFAKTFMDSEDGLDVLINNAGVMATPEMKTTDGYEYQLGVNHLGHFTLTNMVLPKLLLSSGEEEENDDNSKEAAAAAAAARIVCVSSEAHRFGRLEKNDLFYEKAGSYNNWKELRTIEIGKHFIRERVTKKGYRTREGREVSLVQLVTPRRGQHRLGRYLYDTSQTPKWYEELIFNVVRQTMKTPAQGAETSIYLASDPNADAFRGKYFDNCAEKVSSNAARNEDDAKWLWQRSAELTGLDFF